MPSDPLVAADDRGGLLAAQHGYTRSPQWPTVERHFLASFPSCAHCPPGVKRKVNVHHKFPFHLVKAAKYDHLELDPRNLITLCRDGSDSHLLLGHFDSFGSYNVDIDHDARVAFHGMTAMEIRHHPVWLQKVANRPPNHLETPYALDAFTTTLKKYFSLASL